MTFDDGKCVCHSCTDAIKSGNQSGAGQQAASVVNSDLMNSHLSASTGKSTKQSVQLITRLTASQSIDRSMFLRVPMYRALLSILIILTGGRSAPDGRYQGWQVPGAAINGKNNTLKIVKF